MLCVGKWMLARTKGENQPQSQPRDFGKVVSGFSRSRRTVTGTSGLKLLLSFCFGCFAIRALHCHAAFHAMYVQTQKGYINRNRLASSNRPSAAPTQGVKIESCLNTSCSARLNEYARVYPENKSGSSLGFTLT